MTLSDIISSVKSGVSAVLPKDFGFPEPSQQLQSMAKSLSDSYKPTPAGEFAVDTAKTVLRAFPRAAQSVVQQITGQKELKPETGLEKFLFGKEPVKAVGKQYTEAKQVLESGGYGKLSNPLAATAIFGGTLLDLTPVGGSEKSLVKSLVKETEPTVIANLLKKVGASDELIVPFAKRFATATTEAEVKAGLKSLEEVMKGTVQTKPLIKISIPNLSEIKAPEEIKNILVDTANKFRGEIDEARRGIITHTQTEEMADALGMTTGKLLKRRAGQAFNAEEVTAARELLLNSAEEVSKLAKKANNTGADADLFNLREALNRHAAIQQEVSGATAEAGRALNAFKIPASPGQTKTDFYKKALDALGGKDISEEMARKIAVIDPSDFVGMNRFLGQITQATTADKVYEYWVNSILSNPKTHIVNSLSNALTRLSKVPERTIAAGLDLLNVKFTGKPRERFFGEAVSDVIGMTEGFKEGTKRALVAWKTGLGSEGLSKLEAPSQAIKGKLGEIIRIPGRALTAEDEFFKALNSQSELYAQAYRKAAEEGLVGTERAKKMADLIINPTPEMLNAAKAEARYRTFQNELGSVGKAVSNLRNKTPGLKYIMPFMRTPINIAKFGLEMTPLNFLRLGYLNAKGVYKGAAFTDELAKPVMGSVIAGTLAYFAGQGKITGHAPTDKEARDAFYREGKIPYAVRIGNKWYSYQRLEPFASLLGMTADFVNDMDEMKDEDKTKAINAITSSLTQNLVNKTYMSGLSDAMNAIDDPVRYGSSWLGQITGGFVPQALTAPTVMIDPYLRRPSNIIEAWERKIPGLSQNVAPVRDVWGNKAEEQGGFFARAFSPIKQSTAKDDAVDKELKNVGYEAGFPDKTILNFKLDAKHYDIYQRTTGKKAKEVLNQIVANPEYQKLSDEEKKKTISSVVEDVRKRFRYEMGFVLFIDQMDVDIPAGINQQTAAQIFYSLTQQPKFKEASNEQKRAYFIKNLDKYITQ